MSDSFVTIILILIASVMLFMVPMIAVSHRKDVVSTQTVQAAINEFVDSTRKTGKVTQEEFSNLVQTLETTGETYEVNININNIDENPSKKDTSSVVDQVKIGENIYYTEYTTQVEKKLEENNGEIKLSTGDFVTVDVENKSQTMYQNFKKFLYNVVDTTPQVSGIYGGMILEEDNPENVNYNQEIEKNTVIYNRNADESIENIYWGSRKWTEDYDTTNKYEKGTKITVQNTKVIHRPGYKCISWKTKNDGTGEIIEGNKEIIIESDMTLYANWSKMDNCKIIYKSSEDQLENAQITNMPQNQSIQYDEEVKVTDIEPRDISGNYKFKGWSEKPYKKDEVWVDYITPGKTLGRVTNEEKILYAVWERTENYIRYMPNTDQKVYNISQEAITVTTGTTVQITKEIPIREDGIKFLGWSRNYDDNEIEYKGGDNIVINGRITLYAIWGEECEVVFEGNGGKVEYQGIKGEIISTNNVGNKVHRGETINLPNATREGRIILGWSTNKTATMVNDANMKVGGELKIKSKQMVLYAIWSAAEREYKVVFHGNGGKIKGEGKDIYDIERKGKKGEEITIPIAERENYQFLGWSKNKNATSIGAGDIKYNSTTGREIYTIKSDEEYWAVWQYSIIFSVKFHINADTTMVYNAPKDEKMLDSKNYKNGYVLPEDPGRYDEYIFAGWTKTQDGSGQAYIYGDSIKIEGDIELWAQWKIKEYRIIYDMNGRGSNKSEIVKYGDNVIMPYVNIEGYKFMGWSYSYKGNEGVLNAGDNWYCVGDQRFIAIWKSNNLTYKVSSYDFSNLSGNTVILDTSDPEKYKTREWIPADVSWEEKKLNFVPKKIEWTFYAYASDWFLTAKWNMEFYLYGITADGREKELDKVEWNAKWYLNIFNWTASDWDFSPSDANRTDPIVITSGLNEVFTSYRVKYYSSTTGNNNIRSTITIYRE